MLQVKNTIRFITPTIVMTSLLNFPIIGFGHTVEQTQVDSPISPSELFCMFKLCPDKEEASTTDT